MVVFRVLVLSLFGLLLLQGAQAQVEVEHNMHHMHVVYGVDDGLPQNSVYAIAYDAAGYLWVGTEYGLAYFDGVRWKESIGRPPMGIVWDMAADSAGGLWLATSSHGLLWLQPVPGTPDSLWVTQSYSAPEGQDINAVAWDPRGFLWVGTDRGLYRFVQQQWIPAFPESLDTYTISQVVLTGDDILVATDAGAYEIRGDSLRSWELPDAVFTVFKDSQGRRWAGTGTDVWQLEEDGSVVRRLNGTGTVHAFAESRTGELWVGAHRGAWIYDGQTWYEVPEIRDLRAYPVLSLLGGDAVLVGTVNSGLMSIQRRGWHHLREIDDRPLRAVMAVAEDSLHTFWMGASGGRVFRFVSGKWQRVDVQPAGFVSDIFADRDNVWIGGEDEVWRYDGRTWQRFPLESDRSHVWFNRIIAGEGGILWASSSEGIWRWDGQRWKPYLTHDARIDGQYVIDLVRTSQDVLIVGVQRRGLFRVSEEGVHALLPDSLAASYHDVIAIHRCRQTGDLMVATSGGLLLWDGAQWYTPEAYGSMLPLMHDLVYAIEEDDSLYHYLGTRRGVFRVGNGLLERFRQGQTVPVEQFVEEDGLSALETNAGASLYDSRGRVWFGTINGVSLFVPEEYTTTPRLVPQLVFARIEGPPPEEVYAFMASFRKYLIAGGEPPVLVLKRPYRMLTVELGVLRPHALPGSTFHAYIRGYESKPTPWSSLATFAYRRFLPGTYQFVARVRSRDGMEGTPLIVKLDVPPVFWERRSTQVLAFLLLAGLLALGGHKAAKVVVEQRERARELEQAKKVAAWHAFHTRILESVPGLVSVVDSKGEIIHANPRAARWLKRMGVEHFDALLEKVAPSQHEALREAFLRVLRGEKEHEEMEVSLYEGPPEEGGVERRVILHLTPVSLDEDEQGVVITGEDVTQIRQLERFRETFYRMLVHDLRSPISAALMVVREVTETPDMPPAIMQELLRALLPTLEQGLLIVQNILDIGKLEAGKLETVLEPLSPEDVLSEQVRAVSVIAQFSGVEIVTDIQSHEPFVADRALISRIINNLLVNAIKFSPKGEQIILRYLTQGKEAIIEIQDRGPGIPEEHIQHIFERFTSLDKKAGTGLGLAFSRLAVGAMGGRIEAINVSQGGCLFRVVLPRYNEMEHAA